MNNGQKYPCQRDPDLWFEGESPRGALALSRRRRGQGPQQDGRRAIARCNVCPAKARCREVARERREPYGIWGGETTAERAKALGTTVSAMRADPETEGSAGFRTDLAGRDATGFDFAAMGKDERVKLFVELIATEKKTMREVAKILGVSERTACRVLRGVPMPPLVCDLCRGESIPTNWASYSRKKLCDSCLALARSGHSSEARRRLHDQKLAVT